MGVTPLIRAAQNGDTPIVSALIGANASVLATDSSGATALSTAAMRGHNSILATLLGADPSLLNATDANGDSALTLATLNGHVHTVAALLSIDGIDLGVTDSRFGRTPLMWAVAANQGDTIAMLLRAGADPNAVSLKYEERQTAMHF
jgi:ankyrin repeat protein